MAPNSSSIQWRSSTTFIILCVAIALFAESFLYGYVVPILPYLLEDRNHIDPSKTLTFTYIILTSYGIMCVLSAMAVGPLADRAKTRRGPLLIALSIAFLGTLVLATAITVPLILIGRALQAIGGTTAWIVGLATLRDSINGKDMGKAFGLVHSFVSVGALSGPAVAGLLLEAAGYWWTWGVVLLVLVLDIVMRLVMLEGPKYLECHGQVGPNKPSNQATEYSTLLPDSGMPERYAENVANLSMFRFYKVMLSQRRVVVGLLCSVIYSAMLASYNTTVPLHVRRAFGWGSSHTGLLFVGLQGPAILLSPLCGWFRDRFGTKLPATIGFVSLAPLVWLLGAADQKQFPWAATEDSSKVTYTLAILGIGCVTNLMSSVGTIEITCAVDDIESKEPGFFGPNGGYSRSYSLSNLSFSSGLLVGPLLSGALADNVGYYYMNTVLAVICATMSILASTCLGG
ncbi:major facilitator superfamily domain-containing protein [Aspergillus minisclerotigenes]|uniref:Major facilitator superfamily domain-containing protein n=1 Tax=Aspergillus minisclerotigenes TaxID=656917 RepID=A0A5N6IZS7_9EURO|nr:major facilitator superfamily domain-containing protein [Aspergillus minisclerotigenes]